MSVIKFSNGTTVNFNGNPTQSDIEAVAQKIGIVPSSTPVTPVAPPKAPGYLSRVGSAYTNASNDIKNSVNKSATDLNKPGNSLIDELKKGGSLLETGLRTAGDVAGAAFAPITEAPLIHQTLSGISSAVQAIPGVNHVIANATELAAKHPELAKNIESIANIAMLGTPSTGGSSALAEKAGSVLTKSGEKAGIAADQSFIRKLLTPEQTKAIKEDQVSRTSEKGSGVFKRSVVAPTPSQIRSEEAVASVPGVKNNATVQQNYNIIRDANTKAAEDLKNSIAENDFVIPRKEVSSRLEQAAKDLENSPLIVGDAQKTAEKLMAGAREFINNNPGTGSGLLEARKQFDKWVLDQRPNAFDAKAENAFTIANKQIRNAFNDVLDEKATNIEVKKSLSHQSALYNALDTLTPKAATEADTAIGRTLQRIGGVLGTKNKVVQGVAAAAGIGGLGAAATFAPIVAGVGIPTYLIYRAGKLVLKPGVRKGIGQLLEKHGNVLEKSDRAALQGILQSYRDQEDPN